MKFYIKRLFPKEFLRFINIVFLKNLFFLISISYFIYFFVLNIQEIISTVNFFDKLGFLFFSFLACLFSIFFNAIAWKDILIWFGQRNDLKGVVSFFLVTNILKYVPGGIWHFVERFNFLSKKMTAEIAFYSILIEPYFMLSSALLLTSIGLLYSPFFILFIIPCIFLNRSLVYFVLKRLENLKIKSLEKFSISNINYDLLEKIKLKTYFPFRTILIEMLFVISKFFGFYVCFLSFKEEASFSILSLFIVFCISWSIGLIVPAAPGGLGVFEGSFLFIIGARLPQHIILTALIYFRLISTVADFSLALPFLIKKNMKDF